MTPIPPFRLRPEPLDDAAASALVDGFKWASPEVGHRHQLGGEPAHLSGPVPACGRCGELMTFYGQLDSINDEICLADVGVVTVWICFDCFEAHAQIESS